jgi:hypothetical protein
VGVTSQAIGELAKTGMDEAQFRKIATLFSLEIARQLQPTADLVEKVSLQQKELMSRAYATHGELRQLHVDLFDADVVDTVGKTLAGHRRDLQRMLKRQLRILIGVGLGFLTISVGLSAIVAIILAHH